MQIFAYYNPVPELDATDELKLISRWIANWESMKVKVRILSEYHAQQHPMFANLDAAISKLPTVNPVQYERACFIRWLALAQVGGGLIADYDVFQYASPEEMMALFPGDKSKLYMFEKHAPSMCFASQEMAEKLCDCMINHEEWSKKIGRPAGNRPQGAKDHYSDQYFIEDIEPHCDWITRQPRVIGYADAGWAAAPFVHYSNASMQPRGKIPRHQWVGVLR